MAKITRISTTITARYSHASGATDAYYLDGRILGPRESRSADITLDREDKGFLFATFASPSTGDINKDIDNAKMVLDKMSLEIKHSGKSIDSQITDIAECSVAVTGRASLQNEKVRQPYFAGIMVKDSEVAAVTMGRGCAYIYRNDILYPLTKDDIPFEAIDSNGKEIPNIDIYCAGIAGTVRYSNIAQLQVDDCIIVCNREIIDALGQREMLRLLYEANDQCDAAGLIITSAAAKLPGTPLQFMIGFVESITTGEKSARGYVAPIINKQPEKANKNANKFEIEKEKFDDDDYSQDDEYEQSDYENDDEDETYNSSKSKKIALAVVIAIVVLACAFAIYTMLSGNRGGDSKDLTPSPSMETSSDLSTQTSSVASLEESEVVSKVSSTSTATSSKVPTATPTKPATVTLPTNHTIKAGELLPAIAKKYYNSTDIKYVDAIINANKTKYPSFTRSSYQQGWVIVIPKA